MSTVMPSRTARYAKCIETSRKVRWEIDRDVIRGRSFDFSRKFLPDALARITGFDLASAEDKRLVSQIQGRTYANMFGLVERYIGAKLMDLTRAQAFDDQVVVESLVRSTDEELKHQLLFRRLEAMMAAGMPAGYRFIPDPDAVAGVVLTKSTWAVLALTTHIELFTLDHYRQSIEPDAALSELWKDVFLFHMKEESQHAILDEMEWEAEDERITDAQRDAAVGDLIELVGAVDGILRAQAKADAEYFAAACGRPLAEGVVARIATAFLRAYRWQYIASGVQNGRFATILSAMITPEQMQRVGQALAPILADVAALDRVGTH